MLRITGRLICSSILVLGTVACSPAAGDDDGGGASQRAAATVAEPDAAELLLPPPDGARYDAAASAAENEDDAGGTRRYGTGGEFRAESTVTYVYLTEQSLQDVGRYFVDAADESPHYVDLEDMIADYNTGALDVQEEPAAGLPPDEMEAAIREYGRQGVMSDDEVEESLSRIGRYRQIYPAIRDLTLRYLELAAEEESEERDEYRSVDIEIVRPYVDPGALEVRDRTGIVYTVRHMKRQAD